MTTEQMLARLGEIRDAIEAARTAQDTAALYALTGERDQLKLALEEAQQPSRADLERELADFRARLDGFNPKTDLMTGLAIGGGSDTGHTVSAGNIVAAKQAETQQRKDAGIERVEQRIAYLEERLRKLDAE